MLNIVLFGPPGAGKGTQSEKLIDEYQLVHLSTGDLLRSEVAAGTELGLEAKKLMDEGILVPDEIVIEMISSKLDQNKHVKGFIFDGFPRTTNQAKALDKLLEGKNTSITKMISLKVTDEELIERLLLRGKESGRPDDQNEDIILNRIEEYNSKTAPLEDYYAAQGKFEAIDGIGEISEIFYAISSVIKDAEIKEAFGSYSEDDDDEELVESEGEAESHHKKSEESFASKVSHAVKVVKEVVSSKVHDLIHPEKSNKNGSEKVAKKTTAKKATKKAPAKKAATTKAAPAKKTTKKAPAKKASVKKVAAKKSAPKKSAKKVAKKAAPKKSVKKTIKKAAKKVTKKVVKKSAKKAAPKKLVKKVVKKAVAKKQVKKAAPKKAKKAAPKKATKKSVKKGAVKKSAAKKSAPKKAGSKKGGKKRR